MTNVRAYYCSVVLLGAGLILAGCSSVKDSASARQETRVDTSAAQKIKEINRDRALSHFIEGAVFDAKGEYAKAAAEYEKAKEYDPSPAIYYAISRDYTLLGKFPQAAQAARECVRLDSANVIYRENLASIYLSALETDKAIKEYEEIVRIDSNYTSGWFSLARLYQATKPLRALEIYDRILDRSGEDWEVLYQTAEIYSSLGRFSEAAERYKRMLEIDPSNRILQRQLAETYSRAGNFKEAIKILEKILEVEEDNPEALATLADIYLEQREYERALALYQRLLTQAQNHPEIQLRIGVAYFGQIQRDSTFLAKAKPIFEKLSKQAPNDWRPYWYLSMIAATEKDDSLAQYYLQRVTQLAEWNGDAWWYLGTAYFDKGEYKTLLDAMEQAKKSVPKDFRVYLLRGLAFSRLDQPDQAIVELRHALQLKPDDLNTISSLALTLDGLRRFAESDSLYEHALRIDPKYHLVLNNYSYSLAERGVQLSRALEMSLQAVAAEPDNASYLDTAGWIYFKMEKYEEAERYIAKAIDVGGASATVYEHMGDIYFKLGKKDMAEQFWKQALGMNAANQALREKLSRGTL